MENTKSINFLDVAKFSNDKNIHYSKVLKSAFDKKILFAEENIILEKFLNYILEKNTDSVSQIFQDIFASFVIRNDFKKNFLEFGATNGIDLSNTFVLEKEFGWEGVLSEPSPQWHESLIKNRPDSKIIKECIWKSTGLILDFFMSSAGELSTLAEFKESDLKSIPGNTNNRLKEGKIIKVQTISINDVIKNYFKGSPPSYISVDTEGSEYEILSSFDFNKYKPLVFTVEHNFTDMEIKIDKLMKKNGYNRIFNKITIFDAWYVLESTLKKMQ